MFEHDYFKLLADETRLCCVVLIHQQGSLCVCELTEVLQLSQPKISRHLAILRQAGLLVTERKGQWIYYQLSPNLPAWFYALLQQLAASDVLQHTYKIDLTTLNAANLCCGE